MLYAKYNYIDPFNLKFLFSHIMPQSVFESSTVWWSSLRRHCLLMVRRTQTSLSTHPWVHRPDCFTLRRRYCLWTYHKGRCHPESGDPTSSPGAFAVHQCVTAKNKSGLLVKIHVIHMNYCISWTLQPMNYYMYITFNEPLQEHYFL